MEDIITPYELFANNLVNKLRMAIESLIASNTEKDLILSEDFKRLLYANYGFSERLEKERISVSFFESVSIRHYDLNIKSIVIISSSKEEQLREVISFMNQFADHFKDQTFSFYMLIYPRRNFISKTLIESEANERLLQKLKVIKDLNFDFFPLENYLLDLDYELSIQELFVSNEFNIHNLSAEAIYKFQLLFGKFNNIATLGENAERVYNNLSHIEKENKEEVFQSPNLYHNCIIIDRGMDMITPFMTQFTYTGLLDEVFGIKNNLIYLPANFINKTLTNKDKIFFDLKNASPNNNNTMTISNNNGNLCCYAAQLFT